MTNYGGKIKRVVAIIDSYCKEPNLAKKLPKIPEIASMVGLSETTMKREFVKVHKTGIYDFYLSKRMRVARAMMKANPKISIGNLAMRFGYVKTNNFINVFRNVHGITPGRLKG